MNGLRDHAFPPQLVEVVCDLQHTAMNIMSQLLRFDGRVALVTGAGGGKGSTMHADACRMIRDLY